uniref:Uncharacterized protein n=1 Tax=Gasterosteus aculeatus aculeatus TaxID=481459 RepID=A0AAQ4RW33_GASAC
MYLNREENNSKGSVSLSVFLVSVAVTVCAVWLVALCGVCGWCQRKLGKRNKPGVETADAPDSAHGRGEKKGIKCGELLLTMRAWPAVSPTNPAQLCSIKCLVCENLEEGCVGREIEREIERHFDIYMVYVVR